MNNLHIAQSGSDLFVSGIEEMNLADTLDCGQAFRWSSDDGVTWRGIAFGKELNISQQDGGLLFKDTSSDDFDKVWRRYFDLDRDYTALKTQISTNGTLKTICQQAGGIRVLYQDSWEALCSFIISQNNNIPRIKGIIERLCELCGNPVGSGYAFPSAERIAAMTVDDLAPIRSGFRAKYIIDAANKVASGQLDLSQMSSLPIDDARAQMMTVKGVGPKVADCALLFGCGRIECFPVDVWIRRAMSELFEDGLPAVAVPYAGIVQQFIFHYRRRSAAATSGGDTPQ